MAEFCIWCEFVPKMLRGGAKIQWHGGPNAMAREILAENTLLWCGGAKI